MVFMYMISWSEVRSGNKIGTDLQGKRREKEERRSERGNQIDKSVHRAVRFV